MTRTAVFIDYQNAYQGARTAFGLQNVGFVAGQIHPLLLGQHLTQLGH